MNGHDIIHGLAKGIVSELHNTLQKTCVMYRLFDRVKDPKSLVKKRESNPEYGESKFIQDIIGVRIVLYYVDDVDIVREALSKHFTERKNDVSIDTLPDNEFSAKRYNIVYDLAHEGKCPLKKAFGDSADSTFELQIRTIFSEGWHEVEHDLRYKYGSDWKGFGGLGRGLNGVLASLETNEWTMIHLLNELSYRHYKEGNFVAMMRQKLRMRLSCYEIDGDLLVQAEAFEHLKKFQRIDRGKLLRNLSDYDFLYPPTLKNIVFFANITQTRVPEIIDLTPELMVTEVTDAMGASCNNVDNSLELAISIAKKAHVGQFRRGGEPYISHPRAVAELVSDDVTKCVAWLHDVLEDSSITQNDLLDKGLSEEVVTAVCALTKSQGVDYSLYIKGVCKNDLARDVKIADILHNLSDAPIRKNIDKYLGALKILVESKQDVVEPLDRVQH